MLLSYSCLQGLPLISGVLGALASFFGKEAFHNGRSITSNIPQRVLCEAFQADDSTEYCQSFLSLITRGICLLAMVCCNALMLASFMQGMQESGSVAGTALSNAANFATSALLGKLLLNETYSSRWWYGFMLVMVGTLILSSVRAADRRQHPKTD